MRNNDLHLHDLHLTDEQLLLLGSGELSANSSVQIQTHLGDCSRCRERLEELETTQTEFANAHRNILDMLLPPGAGARIEFQSRLNEMASHDRQPDRHAALASGSLHSAWVAFVGDRHAAVLAGLAVAACLLFAIRIHAPQAGSHLQSAALGHWEEPDQNLTPGATLPLTRNEVCGAADATLVPAVPVSLRRKVFEEYGVTQPRPDAYEVDYLITPQLGGATDIRNLWPQPYQDTVWNAHVKDQLEDRLHRMVCHGEVDLTTAQHDISADWIGAYRKYFHVDAPIADTSSSLTRSTSTPPIPLT